MDIEFHYYVTYLIAIAAGFHQHHASIIAWSSQYIDDNISSLVIYDKFAVHNKYNSIATQLNSIFATKKEISKILPIYHFLPGNQYKAAKIRKDEKINVLTTTPQSLIAELSLKKAIESKNLYYIGIATHSFVDTWAHQNFVGAISKFNTTPDNITKSLPNIGHLSANIQPDLMGLIWKDNRLKNPNIDNAKRFLDASIALFYKYVHCEFTRKNVIVDKDHFFAQLYKIFTLPKNRKNIAEIIYLKSNRIKGYNDLATQYTDLDIIRYSKDLWLASAIKLNHKNEKYYWKNINYKNSDWYQFQEAAKCHLHFVLKFVNKRLQLSNTN